MYSTTKEKNYKFIALQFIWQFSSRIFLRSICIICSFSGMVVILLFLLFLYDDDALAKIAERET